MILKGSEIDYKCGKITQESFDIEKYTKFKQQPQNGHRSNGKASALETPSSHHLRPQSGYFALDEGSAVFGGLSELRVKLTRLMTEVARDSPGGIALCEPTDCTGGGLGGGTESQEVGRRADIQ